MTGAEKIPPHGHLGIAVPVHSIKKSIFSCRILRRNSTKTPEYFQKLGWDQRIITMTGTTESAFHHELTLPRPMRELYKIIS